MESVPIYPEGEHGPEADVIARVWHLMTRPKTTTPPLGAARCVLYRWLRGQDLNL